MKIGNGAGKKTSRHRRGPSLPLRPPSRMGVGSAAKLFTAVYTSPLAIQSQTDSQNLSFTSVVRFSIGIITY